MRQVDRIDTKQKKKTTNTKYFHQNNCGCPMHVGCNSIVESWLEAAYNKDRQATTKSPTSTSHSQLADNLYQYGRC